MPEDPALLTADRPDGHPRIVVTGGPGGGKTTAADLLHRERPDQVVIVPEAATILFEGGFPHVDDDAAERAAQRAIFEVQSSIEDVKRALYPHHTLLCDRGTVDGAAYWPEASGGAEGFFADLGTSLEAELARYDFVVFFETAAAGGRPIHVGNPHRIESVEEAVALDRRLRAVWSQHPRFHFVPNHASFLAKVNEALEVLLAVVDGEVPELATPAADGLAADAG